MSEDISTIHVPADQEGPAELQIEQETLDALKR